MAARYRRKERWLSRGGDTWKGSRQVTGKRVGRGIIKRQVDGQTHRTMIRKEERLMGRPACPIRRGWGCFPGESPVMHWEGNGQA